MLFRVGKKLTYGIAIDCGTSGVRAALYSHEGAGPRVRPAVSRVMRLPFDVAAYGAADMLQRRTVDALRRIFEQIPARTNVSAICIGLSSPFYISKTMRAVRQRAHASSLVTRLELDALLSETAAGCARDLFPDMPESEIHLFNRFIVKTLMNGYIVSEPVGKAGKTIEMHVRFELTTRKVYHELTRHAARAFPAARIRACSVPAAYFYALTDHFDGEEGFLLIDIGGEVSDVLLVENGALERVFSLGLGTNLFLREVAALLHISLPDAAFIVRRYAEHMLEENRLQQLASLIASYQKTWQARFNAIWERHAKDREIPPRILVTGGGVLPFHTELLAQLPTSQIPATVVMPSILGASFTGHQFGGMSDTALACITLLCARGVL